MLDIFLEGYNAQDKINNPFMWSSDSWLVWDAGFLFGKKGYCQPIKVKKSRGYSVKVQTHANDFTIKYDTATLAKTTIERH
jgi:hypothetical protein